MQTGDTIHSYIVKQFIGSGGFGEVYQALQTGDVEREVAIKSILPKHAAHPRFIQRFESEAKLFAKLEHAHIVPLYDYWRNEKGAYLVMRWIRGGSLTHIIERQDIPFAQKILYIKHIASALRFAHTSGVMHLDVKPDNILIDERGEHAYLTDFSVSRAAQQTPPPNSEYYANAAVRYASPEQIRQENTLSEQSDIYSLGVVLYELICGKHPFIADSKQALDPVKLIHDQQNTPIPLIDPTINCSQELNAIIQRATAKAPSERYPTMHDMLDDLDVLPFASSQTPYIGKRDIPNPYKGLRSFQESDYNDFFGREAAVSAWIAHYRQPENRFYAIVGASGSGKSSAVQAGLIPRLRHGEIQDSESWYYVNMVPGTDPINALQAALKRVAVHDISPHINTLRDNPNALAQLVPQILPTEHHSTPCMFLLIDQFEELFTLTKDTATRNHFLDMITAAAHAEQASTRIIITLRADFYNHVLLHKPFAELFTQNSTTLTSMDAKHIRETIIRPARRVGLQVDDDLVTNIASELQNEPGSLPLLQYALTAMFNEHAKNSTHHNRLTSDDYTAIGGVAGAIALRADSVYNDLPPDSQPLVRHIFLHLVRLGEGTKDTRKRVAVNSLLPDDNPERAEKIQDILRQYVNARLLTFDRNTETRERTVEVAHEALILQWKMLARWIDESRNDLRIYNDLREKAIEWQNADETCQADYLLRGGQLEIYTEWRNQFGGYFVLAPEVQHFLNESIAAENAARKERTRQQDIQDRSRRITSTLSTLIAITAIALVFLLVITFLAQRETARERNTAQRRANELESVVLVNYGQSASDEDTQLALRLIVEANQLPDAPPQSLAALYTQAYQPGPLHEVGRHEGIVFDVDFIGESGRVVSGGTDNMVYAWDAFSGQLLKIFRGHNDNVTQVAFLGEGDRVVSGSVDGSLIVWNWNTGEIITQLERHPGRITALVVCETGDLMLTGDNNGNIYLWDMQTYTRRQTFDGHERAVRTLAMNPAQTHILSGSSDNTAIYWHIDSGEPVHILEEHTSSVISAAFLTDKTAATGTASGQIVRWNLEDKSIRDVVSAHTDAVQDIAALPNGGYISTSGRDESPGIHGIGELAIWTNTGELSHRVNAHTDKIRAVAIGTHNNMTYAVTGGDEGRILLWAIDDESTPSTDYPTSRLGGMALAISPNSEQIAFSEGLMNSLDGTGIIANSDIVLRHTTTDESHTLSQHTAPVRTLQFDTTGGWLLSGDEQGHLILWDIYRHYPHLTMTLPESVPIWAVAISNNGEAILVGSPELPELVHIDRHTGDIIHQEALPHGIVDIIPHTTHHTRFYLLLEHAQLLSYDARTQQIIPLHDDETLHDNTSLALTPDAQTALITTRNGQIYRVDLNTHTLNLINDDDQQTYWRSAMHPNKPLLATSSSTGISLWNIDTGERLYPFGQVPVWDVAFMPDGSEIVGASQSGRVVFYPATNEGMAAWVLNHRYVRSLYCEEAQRYAINNTENCAD